MLLENVLMAIIHGVKRIRKEITLILNQLKSVIKQLLGSIMDSLTKQKAINFITIIGINKLSQALMSCNN